MINRKHGIGDFVQQFAYNSNINIAICNTGTTTENVYIEIRNSSNTKLVTLHKSIAVEAGKTVFVPQVSIKANEVIAIDTNNNSNIETNISIMEESVLTPGGGTIGIVFYNGDGLTTNFNLPGSNSPALDFSNVDVYIDGVRVDNSLWSLNSTLDTVIFSVAPFDGAVITIKNTIPSGV